MDNDKCENLKKQKRKKERKENIFVSLYEIQNQSSCLNLLRVLNTEN